jgi:hypothetical protein
VGTSSAEAPTAQVLVAQSESGVPDDNLGGDAPVLLNVAVCGPRSLAGRAPSYRCPGLT